MKNSILLLILCLSTSAYTQNWEMFPLDQKMYFCETDAFGNKTVDLYLMDSLLINPSDKIQYFRKKLDLQGVGSCYDDALAFMYFPLNFYAIDYLIENDGKVNFYWEMSGNPFYFLPNSGVGESWDIVSTFEENDYDTISITCSSIQNESFLGITDSVKTYTLQSNGTSPNQTPIDNFVIKLSKNYGLIEFVPFVQFLYHPDSEQFKSLKLIGLETSGTVYGFQQPKFEDYFHLSAGDILLWHDLTEYYPPFWPDRSYYYRDSITQAFITPDSVIYIFDREIKNPFGVVSLQLGRTVKYYKSQFQNILNSPPKWIGFGNNQFGVPQVDDQELVWESDFLNIDTETLAMDTVISFWFRGAGYSIDTSECFNQYVWDESNSFQINTHAGITRYCQGYLSSNNCVTLIGSKIDGVQNGKLIFPFTIYDPTAIQEINEIIPISIFPNPASNNIIINDLSIQNALEFNIFNSTGQSVKSGILTENKLQINDLVPGFYFLVLIDKENRYHGTFVKQ